MPKAVYPLDSTNSFTDQQYVGHNRWHPEVPASVTVKPGDLLMTDIVDVGPIPPRRPVLWMAKKAWATPESLPIRTVVGVSFTGLVHPGLMGTAPSAELLAPIWPLHR